MYETLGTFKYHFVDNFSDLWHIKAKKFNSSIKKTLVVYAEKVKPIEEHCKSQKSWIESIACDDFFAQLYLAQAL